MISPVIWKSDYYAFDIFRKDIFVERFMLNGKLWLVTDSILSGFICILCSCALFLYNHLFHEQNRSNLILKRGFDAPI